MRGKNDNLKIRISSELKSEIKDAADADPDAKSMSDWVRRELGASVEIAKLKRK